MFYDVKGVDPRTKKYFQIYDKYYAGDMGMRNAVVGLDFARDVTGLLENYVFLVLKKYGREVFVGKVKVYDSNKKQYKRTEIDFVASR